MKVLLVAPFQRPQNSRPLRPLFPPLGLLMVAALTPKPWEVELVDEAVSPVNLDTDADIVGITATTARAPRAYELADAFRARGKTVVLGGIHPSALPEEAAQHADAVVIGEAELTWPRLLQDFLQGRVQKFYRGNSFPSLENLPWPRRDLINPENYYISGAMVQTTRGCPFNCYFCSVTNFFGHTFRTRPLEDVVAELESIPQKNIFFVDDNIMGHPVYAKRLFEAVRPLGKRWFGQGSLTMLKDESLVKLAAKSGCIGMFIGMETLSPTNLKKMGKTFNIAEKYSEAIKKLHDFGISIIGSFMFGLDDDKPGVFEKTLEFIQKVKLDVAQFSILTPFPGTRLYKQLEEEGRIIERDWAKYDGTHVTFRPKHLSVEALQEGLRWVYSQAYSWSCILKRALSFRHWSWFTWIANLAYRERIGAWLRELRSSGSTAAAPEEA